MEDNLLERKIKFYKNIGRKQYLYCLCNDLFTPYKKDMLPEAGLRGCKTHNKQERNKKNEENARHPVDNKGGGGEGENILGHGPQTLLGMLVLHYATTGITPFHCHRSV